MKKINQYFTDEDRQIIPNLLANTKQEKMPILEHLVSDKVHRFDAKNYAPHEIKTKLQTFFNGKCAFCEDYMGNYPLQNDEKPDFDWQVEHFRPKEKYKWLGYECTNFLVTCPFCNSTKRKGSHFPIENEIAKMSDFITDDKLNWLLCDTRGNEILNKEKPLLLNPVFDKPSEDLEFQKDGTVIGLTKKGKKSIEIYGLYRQVLVKKRAKIVESLRENIASDVSFVIKEVRNEVEQNQYFEKILTKHLAKLLSEIKDKQELFSAFRFAIFTHFDTFILLNDTSISDKPFAMPKRDTLVQTYRKMR